MRTTPHQPLIDTLKSLKELAIKLPAMADEHTKQMLSKLDLDDKEKYEKVVSEMQQEIKLSEGLNINDLVNSVKNKVAEMNKKKTE